MTRCARGDAEEWPCARRRRQENNRSSRFLPYLTLNSLDGTAGCRSRRPSRRPSARLFPDVSYTSFGDVKTREISFADVLTTDPTRRDRQFHGPRVRPGVTRRAEHARAVALHVRDTARVRARGGGATRTPRRPASRGAVSSDALATSTSRAPGFVSVGRAAASRPSSALATRLRPRGAVLSRAVSGDADKYQIAAAVVRARSAQDDCLEMLLGEMSELSREVRALRSEVEALRAGGGVAARASASPEVVRGATKTSDADDDERVVRQMMDALGATDDDARLSAAKKTTDEASSGQSPPPFPEEDFSDVPVAVDAAAWRGDGTDRSGAWPLCKQGEDDIYLMATMQSCLNDAGFWAGEEDEADFYFGPSTADALCYFQASAGLPETGVCDAETWGALLGAERYAWGPPPGAVGFEEASDAAAAAASAAGAAAASAAAPASPPPPPRRPRRGARPL